MRDLSRSSTTIHLCLHDGAGHGEGAPGMSRPSVYALAPPNFVARLLCRWSACRWEPRTGYDWCGRCQSARWHITREHVAER